VNGVSFSLLVFYFSVDHIQENQLSCDLSLLLGLQCGYIGSSELVLWYWGFLILPPFQMAFCIDVPVNVIAVWVTILRITGRSNHLEIRRECRKAWRTDRVGSNATFNMCVSMDIDRFFRLSRD
jgi:hypothetical protein